MAEHAPPPPYSETDIYSNSGTRASRAPGAYPSSSAQTDTASISSSVHYTPPYTPAESNDDLFVSPAQLYFDSRPIAYRAVGPTFKHEITITSHSRFEDFPYDVSFPDRDITTQDWATFVNFLVPQHIDDRNGAVASEKMKAELLDERMQRLTVDGEKEGLDMSNVDAQLRHLAPRIDPSDEQFDAANVVREWNTGFFEPRGVHIAAHMDVEDPPIVLPDEISEFRRNSFASAKAAGPPLPTRPNFWHARAQSGNDVNMDRRHGRPRNWGWSDHGPGRQANRDCGGRGRHCGRGYRMGISDNSEGCGGCRSCGPRRARKDDTDSHARARTNAEFAVPHGEHFKLGPMVADEKGFRIGSLMRADSEGFQLGPMFIGKSPPSEGSDQESEGSTVSEESEGSLPDLDDLAPRQLPVLRQSLVDWLDHPEQPVSKLQMKQLKSNLKLTKLDKTVPKPEGEELAKLKTDLKEMRKQFREAKKERRNKFRQGKRERKQKKREEKRARRQARIDEKLALKRELRGKGKATHCSKQAAREAQTQAETQNQQIQQQVRQSVNGFPGFVPPPMTGFNPFNNARGPFRHFGRERGSAWTSMGVLQPPVAPAVPTMPNAVHPVPNVPTMPTMPTMPIMATIPRQPSNNSSQSNLSHSTELQDNLSYLRSEAARHISDAEGLRASAESLRIETQNGAFDEKTRVKLSYEAADLETEANRLSEEADRLVAEALQLEMDEGERERREEERGRVEGRDYLRRMRESSGVVV